MIKQLSSMICYKNILDVTLFLFIIIVMTPFEPQYSSISVHFGPFNPIPSTLFCFCFGMSYLLIS